MKCFMIILGFIVFTHLSWAADVRYQFPEGVVYGPKAAFQISAPNSWVLDNHSGLPQGLHCVLYPKGQIWGKSPLMMYAKIASPEYPHKKEFIKFTLNSFKKEDPNFSYRVIKQSKTSEGFDYTINEYDRPGCTQYERVIYIQLPDAVAYVVFIAFNPKVRLEYSKAFDEVIDSFRYRPDYINRPSTMDVEVFHDMIEKIKSKEFDTVEEFLEKNRGIYSKDPEYYVILLNYSLAKGNKEQVLISKGEPKKGNFKWYATMIHSETGELGFITSINKPDVELMLNGIAKTQKALSFFNNRFDIHFGIVRLASLIKHWDIVGSQLLEILKVSKANNDQWEWGLLDSMNGDPRKFVLENVQIRLEELLQVGSEEAYNALKTVSETMVKEYPDVINGYSNLGALYLANNNYELAEKYLNQAIAIDPNDKIVRGNLETLKERRKQ